MTKKICVLAAGLGTRMGSYGVHINKALLPYGEKAAISHILETFGPTCEFVIALGHRADQVRDYLRLAHPEYRFVFVNVVPYEGPGSGPGTSVLKCREQLAEPFYLVCCDTLWTEEIERSRDEDFLFVGTQSRRPEDYCNVKLEGKKITEILDKTGLVSDTFRPFTGFCHIQNFETFFGALEHASRVGEVQLAPGFQGLMDRGLMGYETLESWVDLGTLEKYDSEIDKIDKNLFRKQDEFSYFVEDRVIKFFADPNVAARRVRRTQYFDPQILPEVDFTKPHFYSYQYLPGENLYTFNTPEIFSKLLNWLEEKVWLPIEDPSQNLHELGDRFYEQKTLNRLQNYWKFKAEMNFVGEGFDKHAVQELLEKVSWQEIREIVPSRIHGDLQLANILWNPNTQNFRLIDWRQDFGEQLEYGDLYYDLAKLRASLDLNFDALRLGIFEFDQSSPRGFIQVPEIERRTEYVRILDSYIAAKGLSLDRVKTLAALVYLNMAPLHHSPVSELLYAFGKQSLSEALRDAGADR